MKRSKRNIEKIMAINFPKIRRENNPYI
jgi:hypothetical protein